jgi:dienelactone hydrolase
MKLVFALTASLVLSTVHGAQAQSSVVFTLARGPYTVGFRAVEQYDPTRTFGDAFDDDGKPAPARRPRPIQTSVWYPAATGATGARMKYRDYVDLYSRPGTMPAHDTRGRANNERLFLSAFSVDSAKITRELDAPTSAVRGAPPARGSFPLVVYGPSLGAPSFENDVLMEYLASHGYIVVASPSWGANGAMTADGGGMETQARDMEFLMSYARTLPSADSTNIAVMGFSWGGISNVLIAMRNSAPKALVSLDGSIAYFYHRTPTAQTTMDFAKQAFVDPARFTIPALFLRQGPAPEMLRFLGPDTGFAFFDSLRYSDAYSVKLRTMRHQNFGAWFNRFQTGTGIAFLGDSAVWNAGYERIAKYTLAFLDAYLKQSSDGRAFLARSPAENGFPASEITIERKRAKRPLPTIGDFANAAASRGLAQAPEVLAEIRRADPAYALPEAALTAWGRRLMRTGRLLDAIGVLKVDVQLYPTSLNVHDVLGEAYDRHGDKALAIESYEKALQLDPTNARVVERVKALKGANPPRGRSVPS